MDLYESFRNPSSAFRQAPFWFWNHRLEPEQLEWQIDQMHDKGLGGFVMHARHGLITPYLSDEWFDRIRYCCAQAQERGMIPWAYDERDWPSGPAAGEVIADPANRLQYIRFESQAVEGPTTMALGADVVAAYVSMDGGPWRKLEGASWEAPAGVWTLAKVVRFECPAILWFESYLDTLNPEACEAFIASTYDKHVEKLGDLKALGLEGFFTDEPALSTYPDDLGRIPWTAKFAEAFQARKGYDLLECAYALFEQDGCGPQVRYDYWDVVTGLFEDAYFKAISTWCEKHDVKLIGHALGEEPLFFQFRCLGSIFPYLKHFHMPGMDHLGSHVGKGNPCGMTPKMIESAALLAGRERTMTETFGESGWGLSLREMKWMADWQIANGINYIIPHAFYYSVAGRRKKDSPPSEFFQAPFWPHYRIFADYTARLTSAMTGGRHVAKIAVLYPMSSLWADFVPGQEPRAELQEMETGFWQLGETLRSLHRDFVVVDEASFAKAEVTEKGFSVNGLEFEAIVLPRMTSLHNDTMEMLIRVADVCTAIALPMGYLRVLGAETASATRINVPSLGVRFADGVDARALAKALAGVVPDVRMEGAPEVQYLHRQKEGKDLYFFANTGKEDAAATVSLETVGVAEIWDPVTGERRPAPGQQVIEGRLEIPVDFAPMGSALIVVDPALEPSTDTKGGRVVLGPPTRLVIDDRWHFNPENGNVLTLRNWTLSTQARGHVIELTYATQFVTTEYLANMRVVLDGVPRTSLRSPRSGSADDGGRDAVVRLLGRRTVDA